MNIEQAKAIPLPEILEKIGCSPAKTNGQNLWYFSPFREEKTPSFKINTAKNIWYDFGEDRGGDVISFVGYYLFTHREDCTVADCLRWLSNMTGGLKPVVFPRKDFPAEPVTLVLNGIGDIKRVDLLQYAEERGIPPSLTRKYLREAFVQNMNTGKRFSALALRNDDEGYELRNSFFKGCIGHKTISYIRSARPIPEELHVFEGMFDFLSVLARAGRSEFDGDVIVLNSIACLRLALAFVKDAPYTTIHSWLDNDAAGKRGAEALEKQVRREKGLRFMTMNSLYAPHKDVNEWHVSKCRLTPSS